MALFACAGAPRCALVAVSGGPDSMALLHLAARWRAGGGPEIHAATVDHDLRPDSRAEAQAVARWAAALKVPHSILTGHHADDQAETILFRLLRGSGVAGLAAMSRVSPRGGFRLVRPLLGLPKADLVAFCEGAGQAFFQDPSNRDPRFARTDLKRVLALLGAEGLGRDELLRLGRRAARADEALRVWVAGLRSSLAPLVEEGRFDCAAEALRNLPLEALLRLLEAEIFRIGGSAPRLDRLESLAAEVEGAIACGGSFRGSLAGTLVSVTASGRLLVVKAPPRRVKAPEQPSGGLIS